MTRTVDLEHRAGLLDRIGAYIVEHGVADLSLRPLAAAVGMSPRTLLYHFGSKEAMTAQVLKRVRQRQLALFDRLRAADMGSPGEICKTAWVYMTAPDVVPMVRLFFEVYVIAMRDEERFPGFLDGAVNDWLSFLAEPMRAAGASETYARTFATIVLAGYRGFMLDFVATAERTRIDAALDVWVESLNALFPTGRTHAE